MIHQSILGTASPPEMWPRLFDAPTLKSSTRQKKAKTEDGGGLYRGKKS